MEEDFDLWNDGSSVMDEVRAAAFEYLLLNPGSDLCDWQQGMVEDFPSEVIDAFGDNPDEVFEELANLWETEYTDPATGLWMDLRDWAETFATERAVNLYYELVEAKKTIKKLTE